MITSTLPTALSQDTAPLAPGFLPLDVDPAGELMWMHADGRREPITPVRAFPLSAADSGLSLVGADGREVAWIAHWHQLPEATCALLQQALAPREFAPRLLQLHAVSTFAVPSTWDVSTDRGRLQFVLRAEEDIRRLDDGSLLIASAHGLQLRVLNPAELDRHSRRLLERFL